jgi:two-component system response regulator AtoC
MRVLLAYPWPGNVRELENTLEHAAVMSDGATIDVAALPERTRRAPTSPEGGCLLRLPPEDLSIKRAERVLERELILRALERTGGNRTHAARLLELSHRALLYKIKEFGI